MNKVFSKDHEWVVVDGDVATIGITNHAQEQLGDVVFVELPKIGVITSGGFGPTVNRPIAMGYVETAFADAGTAIQLIVRGQAMPAHVVKLPFIPNNFKR